MGQGKMNLTTLKDVMKEKWTKKKLDKIKVMRSALKYLSKRHRRPTPKVGVSKIGRQ